MLSVLQLKFRPVSSISMCMLALLHMAVSASLYHVIQGPQVSNMVLYDKKSLQSYGRVHSNGYKTMGSVTIKRGPSFVDP